MLKKLFFSSLIALTMLRCSNSNSKGNLFNEYKLSDTLINSGFYFHEKQTIKIKNQNFYHFEFQILNKTVKFNGYIGKINNSLHVFYPTANELHELSSFDANSKRCDSIKCIYTISVDSSYSQQDMKVRCNSGYINNEDEIIHKVSIKNFSIVYPGDNLGIYISEKKGIVGWTSHLDDGSIVYYEGNIYSDTVKALKNTKKVLK